MTQTTARSNVRRSAPAPSRANETPPAARQPGLRRGVELFGRYRLERQLGRGGVAEVWQAHDDRLDRSVAIKVLHPEHLPDAGWRRRFMAEARAASSLSDPGIVPVYDVVDDPKTPAIVFQLVDGESLATRLRRVGALDVADATRIAAQVAAALDHAHRAGLVHRDVKPANIVIGADGRARLVDFGIARLVEEADAERAGREVVGTLRYMAPEQLAGRAADARTDLYALGLVIADMLPDLSAAPAWLGELVDRLRSTDPADRPGSAADVARVLETGRLELPPDSAVAASAVAAAGADLAEVDPSAVTRSFAEPPAEVAEPVLIAPTQRSAPVAESAPALESAPAPAPVPAPSPASRHAPSSARRRTDARPVVAAALVTGLLLAGFAIGRGQLFGAASGGIQTPPATVFATAVPVVQPAAPKPHVDHSHGHGHGGG